MERDKRIGYNRTGGEVPVLVLVGRSRDNAQHTDLINSSSSGFLVDHVLPPGRVYKLGTKVVYGQSIWPMDYLHHQLTVNITSQ